MLEPFHEQEPVTTRAWSMLSGYFVAYQMVGRLIWNYMWENDQLQPKRTLNFTFFPPMAPDVHEDPSKLFFSEDQCSSFPWWHQHIEYTGDPPHGRSVDLGARYLKSHLGKQLESTSKKCCKSKHGCFNSLVPLAFGIWNYMTEWY